MKLFSGLGDTNEREIKRLQPNVDKANKLEPECQKLSDAELRARTDEFKSRLTAATAEKRQELEDTGKELAEAEAKRSQPEVSEFDREELSGQCKRLRTRKDELDKELRKQEKEFLDGLVPEAFAAVREASRRTIGLRHFDVQLIGGMVLHQGKIAEMKTGEGKTLVATLPLYLNALTGRGCHIATVNDYLARRDPYWMGPIYNALGVTVACIYPQTADEQSPARIFDPGYDSGKENDRWRHFKPIPRKEAYQADILYGTSTEFGFDYLRDNMVIQLSQAVQRPLNYAIVDEVDYLLIDEARTPLIISAPDVEAGKLYQLFARIAPALQRDTDYTIDEKERHIKEITDAGYNNVERTLKREGVLKAESLYSDASSGILLHHLRNALTAREFYRRDKEYVVKDGEVIIVDEFTGRLMLGRRYSDGLHQAIEAKEHVKIQQESRTYATITIQNYFRMYVKLAGMTGTAVTEAEEFHKIYTLEVVTIPPNKTNLRDDFTDQIYKNEESKFRAVVREVEELHKAGRPVLVGTASIETSQQLADRLMKRGVPHEVLNAKQHEKEGMIIAQAGQAGAVTIATNMAGRGVDIILGGSPEARDPQEWQRAHDKVVGLGGLHVVGTEHHEARRIDNQLRGRAGRQGDPGSSRFYVSLEDDVVHRFGGDRIKTLMEWAGMDENTPIENKMVNRAIENAQVRVEGFNFDIRKHLVEYDDVVNKQREVIYSERKKLLSGADLKSNILNMVKEHLQELVNEHVAGQPSDGTADVDGLLREVSTVLPLHPDVNAATLVRMNPAEIAGMITNMAETYYELREKEIGPDTMRMVERVVMLRTIDTLWVDQLTEMENMREGIGLEAVGQRDPLVAYKTRGHQQFQNLLETIKHDVAHTIFKVRVEKREAPPLDSPMTKAAVNRDAPPKQAAKVAGKKVGRNDPCPCGSGKKYKHCCGK
jgi:preprotein translocase subunit SecA